MGSYVLAMLTVSTSEVVHTVECKLVSFVKVFIESHTRCVSIFRTKYEAPVLFALEITVEMVVAISRTNNVGASDFV